MSSLLEKAKEFRHKLEQPRKVNVGEIPQFCDAFKNFQNLDIKKLAIRGLEIAPLQFWIMPASMRKNLHHSSEHGIGEIMFDEANNIHKVLRIGGKAFHTLRVLNHGEVFIESDDPRVYDFRRTTVLKTCPGNEIDSRHADIIRTACLWHDIFSGGTEDEFDSKRRGLDKYHPHYHRTEYAHLSHMVKRNEWDLLLLAIEQHMWKWDSEIEVVKFHEMLEKDTPKEAHEYMQRYRVVKTVELSDLLASRNL